ncbi:MAG: response regulator [Saprospiraceae bacterium]
MNSNPLHILLADDDEADRLLFTDAFEDLRMKTTVNTVNNGVELMDYLMKEDIFVPDLLFLDLNMPRKNGLECLMEIRTNIKLKEIPVAIYSTSTAKDDIEKTFLAGANIYIEKPDDFESLKKVLKEAITATSLYKAPPFNRANFLLKI